MTLLVARDRNPTQTRWAQRGNLLAHSTWKGARVSHRKEEKTLGIRVFEIRKKLAHWFQNFLPLHPIHLSMLQERWPPAHTKCHLPSLKSTTERTVKCYPWTGLLLLGREGSVIGWVWITGPPTGTASLRKGCWVDQSNCSLGEQTNSPLSAFNKNHFCGIKMFP